MNENGNGNQAQEEFRIPDFLVSLVGRQEIKIAALEAQLQMFQMQQTQTPATMNDPVPVD